MSQTKWSELHGVDRRSLSYWLNKSRNDESQPVGSPEWLQVEASVIGIRIGGVLVEIAPGFALDPFAPCLFAFCNRERNKIKILHWDHNEFWLYCRRLEKGRLTLP